MSTRLRAPFPYFGSKYDIALEVWRRLGNPANYVEPFAGSLACLLGRPAPGRVETVNDFNGLLVNFWRAVKADPIAVAEHADEPVMEIDLHAWHRRLVERAEGQREKLLEDPEYFDVKLAGRWAWGASAWLGSGWCDGTVPKRKPSLDGGSGRARNGHGVHRTELSNETHQKRPAIGGSSERPHGGVGVHRDLHKTRPHLSNAATTLPHLSGGAGSGVGYGCGVHSRAGRQFDGLAAWMLALAERMRFVRVCCGDFMRVLTPSVTTSHGLTGVFLDPPYNLKLRAKRIYASEDDTAAGRARAWAIENGSNPLLRIALCGYAGEHDMPSDWFELAWQTGGGYGNQAAAGRGKANAALERIWFSPACIREEQGTQYLLPGLNDMPGGTDA